MIHNVVDMNKEQFHQIVIDILFPKCSIILKYNVEYKLYSAEIQIKLLKPFKWLSNLCLKYIKRRSTPLDNWFYYQIALTVIFFLLVVSFQLFKRV